MRKQLEVSYHDIISPENLFAAWQEFVVGKSKKADVQEFSLRLADNILQLHEDLANFTYIHGGYEAFNISDPKPRNIHKASVRDRVLHHAIYRQLYPFFDKTFIADSFSCRVGKGVHKALNRFRSFGYQVSKNHTRTAWVLKCDIRKFFASIDHGILMEILESYVPSKDIMWLLGQVIDSFCSERVILSLREDDPLNVGLPLGNLTSQLFCNIYMNEFDQFVKHRLKTQYYIRYADDFVFLSESRSEMKNLIPTIVEFLDQKLKLVLHQNKVFIKTLASGVDFLGWTHFSHHRVLRSATKRRMFKRIHKNPQNETLQSYLGLISHGNTFGLKQEVLNNFGLFNPTLL